VYDLVITPTVQECVNYFHLRMETSSSMTMTNPIVTLRNRAMAMATNNVERQYIAKQLHLPTIYLRNQYQYPQQNGPPVQVIADTEDNTHVWNETTFLNDLSTNVTNLRNERKDAYNTS
jgi:hypothetical protein